MVHKTASGQNVDTAKKLFIEGYKEVQHESLCYNVPGNTVCRILTTLISSVTFDSFGKCEIIDLSTNLKLHISGKASTFDFCEGDKGIDATGMALSEDKQELNKSYLRDRLQIFTRLSSHLTAILQTSISVPIRMINW